MVAVAGGARNLEILDRRRIVTMDSTVPGGIQPYHYAAKIGLPAANKHIENCARLSKRMARSAIQRLADDLESRDCLVVGCVVLLASGRPLPALPKILSSHPLIHTAEGEFFRGAVVQACKSLKIPVIGVRERQLDEQARAVIGKSAGRLKHRISGLGKVLGPPWRKDQKTAALAAATLLVGADKIVSLAGERLKDNFRGSVRRGQ